MFFFFEEVDHISDKHWRGFFLLWTSSLCVWPNPKIRAKANETEVLSEGGKYEMKMKTHHSQEWPWVQ